jgi:hypothetical protein
VSFKVDTGADMSVITPAQFEILKGSGKVKDPTCALSGPGGQKLKVVGVLDSIILYGNTHWKEELYVVDNLKQKRFAIQS